MYGLQGRLPLKIPSRPTTSGGLTDEKPKAPPAAAAASTPVAEKPSTPAPPAAPGPGSSSNTGAGTAPATPTPAAATAGAGTAASDTESASFSDPSALAIGPQRDAAIANMESMGFPRAEIDRAMRAAFFNPDRAVEYLLNVCTHIRCGALLLIGSQGIPENVQQEQRQPPQAAGGAAAGSAQPSSPSPAAGTSNVASPSAETGDQPINLFEAAAQAGRGGSGARSGSSGAAGGAGTGGAGAGALGNLEFLRNNPQFQQLRQVVQQQPHMLEPILQQVGAGNPQLAQLIGQNPDQFLQLLSEDVDDDAPLPPGAQAISVTEEEREAIERVSGSPDSSWVAELTSNFL